MTSAPAVGAVAWKHGPALLDEIVPMHYDMFAGNPGHLGWFAEYCAATYPEQGFHIPARGKRWIYVK